jgi:hypothetical protein
VGILDHGFFAQERYSREAVFVFDGLAIRQLVNGPTFGHDARFQQALARNKAVDRSSIN